VADLLPREPDSASSPRTLAVAGKGTERLWPVRREILLDRVSERSSSRTDPSSRSGRSAVHAVLLVGLLVGLLVAALLAQRACSHLEHGTAEPDSRGRAASAVQVPTIADDHVLLDSAERITARQLEETSVAPVEALDPTPRELVDVLVVDGATGAPVAGALVRWANMSEIGPRTDPTRPRWQAETFALPDSARQTTSGERGLAHVDARLFPGTIVATHGDLSGRADADHLSERPIRVALTRVLGLAIQVVDTDGQPVAGVPVCLRDEPNLDTLGELWRGTTEGADGIAHVRRLTVPRKDRYAERPAHACIEIPSRIAICSPVDLANPPADPVRLVLPPWGSVVVTVIDSSSKPADVLDVSLALAGRLDARGGIGWGMRTFAPESLRDGVAVFPFVELALELHAEAMGFGPSATARGPGPRIQWERVDFTIGLGPALPVLTGRIVTESGEPIRRRFLQVSVVSRNPHAMSGSSSRPHTTDGDGGFRVAIPGVVGQSMTLTFRAEPIGIGVGESGIATVERALTEASSVIDLGDVVCRVPRIIGSGVVVDDLDRPVKGAQFAMHVSRRDLEDGAWREDPLVRWETRRDGSFDITTTVDVTRLRVRALRAGHADSATVEFEPGARGLRLVVPRACELSGRALLDDDPIVRRIRVRLIVPGAQLPTGPLATDREVFIAADGSFRIAPIGPGRYDLDFRIGETAEPFHRIEGIEVAPAGRAVDARLDAIDLRGRVPGNAPR